MSVNVYVHAHVPIFQTQSIQKDIAENEVKTSSDFKDTFGKAHIPVPYIAL